MNWNHRSAEMGSSGGGTDELVEHIANNKAEGDAQE